MDLAQIKELLRIVAESGVAEVEIEEDEFKLVVRKNAPAVTVQPAFPPFGMAYPMPGYPPAPPPAAPASPQPAGNQTNAAPQAATPVTEQKAKTEETSGKEIIVKAPIVGTFYRGPAPGDDPFVEVGDEVTSGQVLCIIEAMKLMNEIECEANGIVTKILVEDAQPVEYDQPLFLIDAA